MIMKQIKSVENTTMRSYRSSLGFIVAVPIAVIMGVITPIFILNGVWFGLAVNLLVFLFILHMFLTTRYTISDDSLKIVSGFIYRNEIPIRTISRITPSNNPISSPAFSLDRLEIRYNGNDSVLVSPKEKEAFLRDLKEANPAILLGS